MTRRLLVLLGVAIASFACAAGAVAYFADSEETYDVVRAGPPIPWLKVWSEGTDPLNLDANNANNVTYATKNNVTPVAPAATGKIDGATQTIDVDLGKRSQGAQTAAFKLNADTTNLNLRYNRLVTVEVPSNAPIGSGQTVSLSLAQENSSHDLSGSPQLFSLLEFASLSATNTETNAAFRGTGPAATVQLGAGEKRQINVKMREFGQTDNTASTRIVTTAILVSLTTPGGDVLTYRVPVRVCNHQNTQQCN